MVRFPVITTELCLFWGFPFYTFQTQLVEVHTSPTRYMGIYLPNASFVDTSFSIQQQLLEKYINSYMHEVQHR